MAQPSIPTIELGRKTLRAALARIRRGQTPIVPAAVELRRPRPRAHFHATPELFVQTGGTSFFECPADRFELTTGRTCIIPPGVPHAETPHDTRTPYGVLVCMQSPDGMMLHRGRGGPGQTIEGYGTHRVPSARAREAFGLLERIDTGRHLPAPDRAPFLRSITEAFLLTILAELDQPSPSEDGSPLVAEAEKLALAGLPDPALTVARLARSLGCTPDHLSRTFHAERGRSLKGWITAERLTLARQLLGTSRHQIAEVGWACGFARPSYFIRVFSAQTGMTPGEFRRAQAGGVPAKLLPAG